MNVHRWIDKFGDMGEVWASGDVVCMAMQERYKIASHDMHPDTARAVAEALNQAAFEIDGKGATVIELTAQLEQARAEIERYKQATNSLIEKWKTIAGYQSCDDDSCDDDNPYNTVVRDLESVLSGNNDPQCLECVCDNDELASDSVIGDPYNAGRKG